jgi:group I intron endonuclease
MHYIYRITNIENKKAYIGQTNNPDLRWSQHKSNAKYNRGQQVITRAISKYGVDKFEFIVIASCLTQANADKLEEIIIAQYDSQNFMKGYNVDAGGNTTPRTLEILRKISEGLQKYYETHSNWNKGRVLTEEWKKKISESHIGLIGTNTGKTFSEAWKKNMSAAKLGKVFSKEHIKNLSKSHFGNIPYNRKLTFEIAEQIRVEYGLGSITQKQLGVKYGLSQSTTFSILKKRTYLK